MRQAIRFVVPLLAVLALLAWGASVLVNSTSRRWFDEDVDLRARLAVRGAREGLAEHWRRGDRAALQRILESITRDERITAAAACGPNLETLAATPGYPEGLGCEDFGAEARAGMGEGAAGAHPWRRDFLLPGGRVHVNALPILADSGPPGIVILVHDMSFADRREAATRWFMVLAFAFMAILAALVTTLAARFSWRSWTAELRGLLRGTPPPPEFRPVLRDVRDLVARLAVESGAHGGGAWTPERLRQTLRQRLHGETVTVVANREPYIHERDGDGTVRVLHPASGLVTAIEPVMRACSGVWVAHGSGSADRQAADHRGRLRVPPGEESYTLRRVWLSPEEESGYYYGFSNEGLWPLCHLAHARPIFRSEDWAHYRNVNRKFADAVAEEVDGPDPIVLVQDYHLALLPRLIRERLPRATILTFWHTPWPNPELFGICPWHKDLLEGMLGSSILGFHTQQHCNNFLDAVDRYLESRLDREQRAVVQHGRTTLIRAYPISIEWPNRWLRGSPPVPECRAAVFAELGLPPDALLGVGVDRLDYTKGIEERLLAVERLLERSPHWAGRLVFAELAAPSRTAIARYQELNRNVEQLAARINERFGRAGYRPVHLLRRHHEPPAVFRFYRAADVCYVSSLHDGMNLVAKEFVAARDDERGVLVLSCFTGAARELTEALIVNPYDIDSASLALASALSMSPQEQADRMRAMRQFLAEFNVYRWAGQILIDAARVRQRERLSGRLADHVRQAETSVQ
jgi:trehalose 6-phosphate synthase